MTTLFELAARLQSANAAEGMLWMVLKATLILAIARLLLMVMPRASAHCTRGTKKSSMIRSESVRW